jgi:hypothetical protein
MNRRQSIPAVMVVREQEDVPQLPFQDITTDELKYLKL